MKTPVLRLLSLIILLEGALISQGIEEAVFIHHGNGMILKQATLVYDTLLILEIEEKSPPASPQNSPISHITPLMADLNIYKDISNFGRQDSIMLSRGIAMYIHSKGKRIFMRYISHEPKDSLIAWIVDLTMESESDFYKTFTHFQDNLEAFHAMEANHDNLLLPWADEILVEILSVLYDNHLLLWFKLNTQFRHRLLSDFMQSFPYRSIVESKPEFFREFPFSNSISLISLDEARSYLYGDLQENNTVNFLDYNEEFLIKMPQFNSFWESLIYFNSRESGHYTDTQILQLYTVIPYSFFSNYVACALIEEHAPAQFVHFSTYPFSIRSRVQGVIMSGRNIYDN
ncbi:MAG: hypothetical protein KAI81_08250 [Candidatus Marinimicrobia bacterium]|nr:hypothetical protein [Candidatus Neomarinimicrobiota bacterium]